jgi:hypothetical protein
MVNTNQVCNWKMPEKTVDSLKFVVIDVPIKSHNHCSHLHPGRLFILVRIKKKPNCPHTSP